MLDLKYGIIEAEERIAKKRRIEREDARQKILDLRNEMWNKYNKG